MNVGLTLETFWKEEALPEPPDRRTPGYEYRSFRPVLKRAIKGVGFQVKARTTPIAKEADAPKSAEGELRNEPAAMEANVHPAPVPVQPVVEPPAVQALPQVVSQPKV